MSSRRSVLRAIAAGYLVVAVFGVGYFVARLGADESMQVSSIVGAMLAAPLAVAFLGDRLSKVAAFGITVELARFERTIDRSIAVALAETQYFSGRDDLITKVREVAQKPDLQLVEINLRNEPYWWSTRIYLQAALLESFARNVQRIVFVEGDTARRFVGMASPSAVRYAFGGSQPALEQVRAAVWLAAAVAESDAPDAALEPIVHTWAASTFDDHIEIDARRLIGAAELTHVMGRDLERSSIEWSGKEDDTLRRLVVAESGPFVAIVEQDRLQSVVDAADYTRQVALDAIRHAR